MAAMAASLKMSRREGLVLLLGVPLVASLVVLRQAPGLVRSPLGDGMAAPAATDAAAAVANTKIVPTAFSSVTGGAKTVPLYSLYEINFDLPTTYSETDRFDPAVIDVSATFHLPGGAIETVPGFYKQDASPNWAVRYTPRAEGDYMSTLKVVDGHGARTMPGPSFGTTHPTQAGFLSVEGTRLRTTDGNAFVIDGVNALAPGRRDDGSSDIDFSHMFGVLAADNMNFCRIWANAHWNVHSIERGPFDSNQQGRRVVYKGIGNYNLTNAAVADDIFRNASTRGIRLMWTLTSFGDWGGLDGASDSASRTNAYMHWNGGPLNSYKDVWTNEAGKSFFKRYLRYNFARWGGYASFGMLEYWNEFDQDIIWSADAIAWHRDMDAYWKSLDIYRHPTTTSFAWKDHVAEGWAGQAGNPNWNALTFLDVTNQHRYGDQTSIADIWDGEMTALIAEGGSRPAFIAEFGISPSEDATSADPNGYYYHDGAWAPFFFGKAAGTNLIWRVDQDVIPHGVTASGFKAFAAFTQSEKAALPTMLAVGPTTLPGNVRVGGYQNEHRALLLFRDWNATWKAVPETQSGVSYTLRGLTSGRYTIQFWDTMTGAITQSTGMAIGSSLALNLPTFKRALGVRVFDGSPIPTPRPYTVAAATARPLPTGAASSALRPAVIAAAPDALPSPTAMATVGATPIPAVSVGVTSVGGPDGVIYDGTLRNGWHDQSWGGRFDFSTPYAGMPAIAVTYSIGQAVLVLHNDRNVATAGHHTLRLGINGSDAGGQRMTIRLADWFGHYGLAVNLTGYLPGGVLAASQWLVASIPLADLGFGGTGFNRIELANSAGGGQPTFYLSVLTLN